MSQSSHAYLSFSEIQRSSQRVLAVLPASLLAAMAMLPSDTLAATPTHPLPTVDPAQRISQLPAPTNPTLIAPQMTAPANPAPIVPQSIAPQSIAPQSIAPQIDEAYVLGAGDRIAISIFNVPEYSGEQQVLADGSLNLPLVGKIAIEGMTLEQAEATIATSYAPELRYPLVTVSLLTPRPVQVAVAGEVRQPGSYILPLSEDAQFPTLVQAIQAAGGATQAANLGQVQIERERGGTMQTIAVDLWQLLRGGNLSQNIELRDGDRVVIAATTEVNIAETAQLAASNLAASADQVLDIAVVGEVFRPGAYKLGGNNSTGGSGTTSATVTVGATGTAGATGTTNVRPTITQAIQLAGGIKPSGDIRDIEVRRLTRSGETQVINVNFWQLLREGDLSQDLVLQQGDTIVIPVATTMTPAEVAQLTATNLSPGLIQVNIVGEVETPGAIQLPASTTLNQAILAAGGLNDRSKEEVELIRLNPNGTITQQVIEVDLRQGLDSETNPILWNSDIIIAGRSGAARLSDQLTNFLGPILQLVSPIRLLF